MAAVAESRSLYLQRGGEHKCGFPKPLTVDPLTMSLAVAEGALVCEVQLPSSALTEASRDCSRKQASNGNQSHMDKLQSERGSQGRGHRKASAGSTALHGTTLPPPTQPTPFDTQGMEGVQATTIGSATDMSSHLWHVWVARGFSDPRVVEVVVDQVPAPALVVTAQQRHVALALQGRPLGGEADHCHGAERAFPPDLPGVPPFRKANLAPGAVRALGDRVAVGRLHRMSDRIASSLKDRLQRLRHTSLFSSASMLFQCQQTNAQRIKSVISKYEKTCSRTLAGSLPATPAPPPAAAA
ncbi:hypothetical protein EYF80_017524 [Liparis tanakae]|uniref:Uncharacterized protein n=1 Tax=Liparis tanakae TaxID=230148 RepID=A0A4Z2I338_9TELE|nr:hypothetical protein EYF80_017524 [Liparis tanakae]